MIDSNRETIISLTEAAALLPRRRGGKKPHVSCIYRWTTTGCKGVILESIQVGGTRCTSHEALGRFFEALTFSPTPHRPTAAVSPARRQRAAEAADRALEQQGA